HFKEGQKHVTPPQGDSTRGFYESLLEEKPDSVMAIRYCVEYGIFAGEKYVLHSDLAEGRENMEAHYSKMMVVLRALETSPTIEWLMFIDCDAFFTDFTTSLDALVDTFAPEGS
ncbi:hypothetical protein FOZ63_013068, partial [Perkinsus olseni]